MLDEPFRGTVAVRRGLLTRGQLHGPRYRRLLPDVYVPVGTALELCTRSRAAYLHVAPRGGVLAGFSAAALLGRGCALRRVPAEVPDSEVTVAGGCRVTVPLRAAWDLARRLPLVEAVVAVDALARWRAPRDPGFPPCSEPVRRHRHQSGSDRAEPDWCRCRRCRSQADRVAVAWRRDRA